MDHTIVVLDPISEAQQERLRAYLPEGFRLTVAPSRDEADQVEAMRHGDFAITADVPVTEAMMRAGHAAGMKGVHKWGVGVDNVDVAAAKALGLWVMRTTGSNARAVAETTVGLMLALQRSIVIGHEGMRRGEWLKGAVGPRTLLLTGKTIGLVGLGYIGKNVARMLAGFDCQVLYTKPTPLPRDVEADLGVTHASLDRIIAESDILSLHCALTEATRGLIDAKAMAAMKNGALLVNTARGGIVDEDALADALESGKLRGAAVDVFEVEPTPPGHRLLALPTVIATPHMASQAADNFGKTVSRMFENIRTAAIGDTPPDIDVVTSPAR